jgi:hypothetical protein
VTTFAGDAMGIGMELTAGTAYLGDGMRALGSAGAFAGAHYGELGYSYQIPIDGGDRMGLIASHMFSLRATVPFFTYDRVVTKERMPPPDEKEEKKPR